MDTLEIDVKGWPEEYVDMLKTYVEQVTAKFEGNDAHLAAVPKPELPDWPGSASVPPQRLRREELYKADEHE